ncbi:HlyD family efflux transporter periplasmic adaptor subunit [Bremerella sp. JC817]|uniref:efflux RND transporter periplasmic adaptor subunit n=1 Tax=Bremerella sp. JC817 TaxID=3231756 RepID=UPI00345AB520
MFKFATLSIASLLLITGQVSAQTPANRPMSEVVVEHCLVSLIDEVNVPAQETGVLIDIPVERGDYVTKGFEIAQIDDAIPVKQREIAKLKWDKATEQATNEVDIKYAAKAAEVSRAEFEQLEAANKGVKGAIAEITIRKAKLQWEKAILQAEQADMNYKVAGMTAGEAQAEMEAAQMVIDKCKVTSPIDGVVVQKYRHAGEWVRPGDPLMRVVGLKRLKVDGSLDSDKFVPGMVIGKPVTVEASTPGGMVTFEGTVVFASPEIDATGHFDFTAEVQNRPSSTSWMLFPGDVATVTVHLDRPSTISALFDAERK